MKNVICKLLAVATACVLLLSMLPLSMMPVSAISYSGSSSYMSGVYYQRLCAVTLTGNQATDIVNVAASQIGYKSGSSNSDLSGSTSSTSNVKYSEYGRVIGSNPNDWCAYFVSWCARQAGVSTSVFPNFAGCTNAYNNLFSNVKSRSSGYIPKAGDLIFFGNSTSDVYHVGVVKSATSSTVYYIDGNNTSTTPHCVKDSSCSLSYSSIIGYAIPNYGGSGSGTHTHEYEWYYESAHAHRVYMQCGCGDYYYTGETVTVDGCSECSHKHSYKRYFEADHAHRVYMQCSCGDYYYTGETVKVDSCAKCQVHTHSYEWYYESAHAHRVYMQCSCGDWYYTGETVKVDGCEECQKKYLSVYYNVNGGALTSDTYSLSGSKICNKSDGSAYCQTWTYNNAKTNGLTNAGTFGLTRQGYTFLGWSNSKNGGTVFSQSDASIVPTDLNANIKNGDCSVTLYAQWAANTLSVQYNANGGTLTSDTYSLSGSKICNKADGSAVSQTWTYNKAKTNGLTNAETFGLARQGYTFIGWSIKQSGGTVFDQNDVTLVPTDLNTNIKTGDCSVTLYAQWRANELTVQFHVNGGNMQSDKYKLVDGIVCRQSDNAKELQYFTYNNANSNGSGLWNASSFGLYREGYTFVGWSTKTSGGTVLDQNDVDLVPTDITSDIKTGDCSVTLYAQWRANELTVQFHVNGGNMQSDKYKLVDGIVCRQSDNAKELQYFTYNNANPNGLGLWNASSFGLYREGYTFVGWSTKTSGGTVLDQNDVDLVPTDITSAIKTGDCFVTLYAVWEKAAVSTLPGDMTDDGALNMMDALLLYNAISVGFVADEAQQKVADYNGDGTVNMMDALLLYGAISG